MATVKIRIAVAVDPGGRWLAQGWPGLTDAKEILDAYSYDTIGPCEVLYWVTVDLEIPEPKEALSEAILVKSAE